MQEFIETLTYFMAALAAMLIAGAMIVLHLSVVFIRKLSTLAVENPDALRDFAYGLGRILGMPAE